MNSVHPYHNKEQFFKNERHIVLTFHDSIFECIAQSFEIRINKGSMQDMVLEMTKFIL